MMHTPNDTHTADDLVTTLTIRLMIMRFPQSIIALSAADASDIAKMIANFLVERESAEKEIPPPCN